MNEQETVFSVVETAEDKKEILRLRELVYVQDQGRLEDADDMTDTFDRFDAYADYLIARTNGEPVGCVKVVRDSERGLPCEGEADLTEFKHGHSVVELGHLMTLPTVRNQMIGMGLMRAGLLHGILRYGATRLVGDFFVDKSGGLIGFYRMLGFVPLSEPYADERFAGAPLSLVAGLDFAGAEERIGVCEGRRRQLLEYFFHDYTRQRQTYLLSLSTAGTAADADR